MTLRSDRARLIHQTRVRLMVMTAAGVIVAGVVGGTGITDSWPLAAIVGWAASCAIYVSWVWLAIGRLGSAETQRHATREDPARTPTDVLIIVASVASLVAVVVVLVQAKSVTGWERNALAALGIVSVALSWLLVHTLFSLRYARLYYSGAIGGVDFNQQDLPRFTDFAYLGFTIGMTFQVSDTSITAQDIRATALRHALLSFVFGSVIVATTVNLVAGLA